MEADGNEVVRNLKYVTAYSTASYPASSRSYLSVPSSLIDQPSPQELIPKHPTLPFLPMGWQSGLNPLELL